MAFLWLWLAGCAVDPPSTGCPDCVVTPRCADDDVDEDGDGVPCGRDCDDADARVSPAHVEICANGRNDDCNAATPDITDRDRDGVMCHEDCDDADPAVAPGLAEICDNGVDDDCSEATPDVFDGDGDGVDCLTDCDDTDAKRRPGLAEVCGNGVDDDCDVATPDVWDGDLDGVACDVDCDDGNAAVLPGAIEVCLNGTDDDCDVSTPDDGDGDGDGVACATDCDDADSQVHPGAAEVCNNGVDDDCDPATLDRYDLDLDGWDCVSDCDDDNNAVYPTRLEVCNNGIDDDCNAFTQDVSDNDGDGSDCIEDCDDRDDQVAPGKPERCNNGRDDDCNPATGEDHGVDTCDAQCSIATSWPAVDFVDVTATAQLSFPPATSDAGSCYATVFGTGAAAADYDADGHVDLFVAHLNDPDQLWRNRGDGTFEEVGVAAGVADNEPSSGALWVDLNADAWLDLVVVSAARSPTRAWVNDGNGGFVDQAVAYGIDQTPSACGQVYSVSAGDYDRDGRVDLHTAAWQAVLSTGLDRSRLFRNTGSGFVDATVSAGVGLPDRSAFTTSFVDVDGNGWLDLLVASDWAESGLFFSDGDGTFTEDTVNAGVGTDENGMGSDAADYDNDGDIDWFVTAIYDSRPCGGGWGCTGNRLYDNDGTGVFTDRTDAAGVRNGGWGWGAAFFDFDNDGWLDLGHTGGFGNVYFNSDRLRLYHNDGAGAFVEVGCQTGLVDRHMGRGFLPFDFDGDGDLDVFLTGWDHQPRLLRNDGGDAAAWIEVSLRDDGGDNRFGLGAQVWVRATPASDPVRRDVHANSNFLTGRPPVAHVGLGAWEGLVDDITVVWPDGTVQTVRDVPGRQRLTLIKP